MILGKIQVNTISAHPENVFALAVIHSREKFVKINLKTYFYGDAVFSAMQTLAMYLLKMSTVYEVT